VNRLLVWGGKNTQDSTRHVWRAFHSNAVKLGIPSAWVDDDPRNAPSPGDTVLACDVTGRNLPYVAGVDYVLHNWSGDADLCRRLEGTPERLLRLQVYTNAATGEDWGPCRRFDLGGRVLFQPWGSDLLREEFYEPVFNPGSRELPFVGAIWSDKGSGVEQGNEAVIQELREACKRRGLTFRHLTHVSDAENVAAVRGGRLAPAFAGAWQVEHDYVPCRALKAAAYGQLPLTNVPVVLDVLGGAALRGSVGEVVDEALGLNQTRYCNLVREVQRAVAQLTYRESLASIDRAFEAIRA
jgi:hypothetical protein